MNSISKFWKLQKKFESVSIMLLINLAIILLFLFYVSNKGFEFSDEGLYALLSNPKQENTFRAINYDIIYKYIYQLFNITFDIQELRLIRILVNLLGSFIFFLGFKTFNDRLGLKKNVNINLLIFIIICGFCNYLAGNVQTPGYNAFHFLDLQLIAGSLLALCYKESGSKLHAFLFCFLLIIGLALCWLTKPTGIPLLLFLIAFCLYYNRHHYNKRVLIILFSYLIIFIFLISRHSIFSKRLALNAYKDVFNAMSQNFNSHSMDVLINRVSIDIVLFAISVFIGYLFQKVIRKRSKGFLYLYLIGFLALLFIDINRCYLKFPVNVPFYQLYIKSRIFIFIFLFIAFYLGYFFMQVPKNKKRNVIFLISFSLVLTVSFVFGSNGNNFSLAIACSQFLLISFWVCMPQNYEYNFFKYSTILIFLFLVISNSFNSTNQKYLFDLKYRYEYGKNSGSTIFLDHASFLDQKKIDNILQEYNTPYIVAYTRMPGNIYFTGKTSPGSFLWGEEDLQIYFQFRFNQPKNFILLLENNKSEVLIHLKPYHISFIKVLTLKSRPKGVQQIYVYNCEYK